LSVCNVLLCYDVQTNHVYIFILNDGKNGTHTY